ncbi:hypothetical protein EXH44_06565 [Actinobacillus indolicus]|uniref:DUF5672 domain-containing protein n=1 Tax=Actinobacillus indolicus TaxID=51049 RepID=A0A4P7CFY0_9PAST|nr:DUF5672 family protein [Actinobacillus indolicus]QBQ63918.1 hypothetical protein EXH44_06565 [Actinobacillus indolicus]
MNKSSDKNTKTLTIVSVTGHQAYAQGSAYAIERSYEELQKKLPVENLKCVLISPERPEHLEAYVQHIRCKPFSYLEYNLFILYALGDLIDTDFALVVQNDGFVVNGDNWKDEFFNYDFIGAPLYCMYEYLEDGSLKQYNNEQCDPFYENMPEHVFEGQNGGFSLRSKRILKLPRELKIKFPFPIPEPISVGEEVSLDYTSSKSHYEDIVLTVLFRKQLLQKDIKFAPPKISTYFACESANIHSKRKIPLTEILGCHTFGYLVLKAKNTVYMQKKVKFRDDNIATNSWCNWLLASKLSIDVPRHFLEKNND